MTRCTRMTPSTLLLTSLISWASLALPAQATQLHGRAVGIQDGDTLTILVGRQATKVRIAEIDTPERQQAFGQRAREALAYLCHGQSATFDSSAKDDYGRTVSRVSCAGTDVSAYMVSNGLAWVYPRYASGPRLFELQDAARAQRRGLWADPNPIPPWDFRHTKK